MQDEKILLELARLILPSGFIENFYHIDIHLKNCTKRVMKI